MSDWRMLFANATALMGLTDPAALKPIPDHPLTVERKAQSREKWKWRNHQKAMGRWKK